MKILTSYVCLAAVYVVFNFEIFPVTGQVIPIIAPNNDNDDLGVLLTILLLASQNRNKGNCGCCNNCPSGCGGNILIPYPVPIPTTSPVIRSYSDDSSDNYDDADDYYDDANTEEPSGSVAVAASAATQTTNGKQGGTKDSSPNKADGQRKTVNSPKNGSKASANGQADKCQNKGNHAKGQGKPSGKGTRSGGSTKTGG